MKNKIRWAVVYDRLIDEDGDREFCKRAYPTREQAELVARLISKSPTTATSTAVLECETACENAYGDPDWVGDGNEIIYFNGEVEE